MQKRKMMSAFFFGLFFVNLVSASYYGSFSLSSFLDSIDQSTMILGAIFLISFAFINFSASKYFKDNKPVSAVVSFVFSLLITYWVNKNGFDIEGFVYELGFSGDFLYSLLPIILLIGAGYLIWKIGFSNFLLVAGVLIGSAGFLEIVYASWTAIFIGAFLVIAGILWKWEAREINMKWGEKKDRLEYRRMKKRK